jgi:hypothetical protein
LGVPIFESGPEAKEYLVGRIVEEAGLEGVPLSEIETKMLYFSETAWTLPDMMEVNRAFDGEYDAGKYEEKIAGLIRGLRAEPGERNSKDRAAWDEAVCVLNKEDHYLMVLLGFADGTMKPVGAGYPDVSWGRFLRIIWLGVGIFLVFCALFGGYLVFRYLIVPR